jgi:hypothetical protein
VQIFVLLRRRAEGEASRDRSPRRKLLVGGLVIAALTSCCSPRYPYPEAFLERYEKGCESAADFDACMCVLERLQNEVPYEEGRAFENGESPYQPYTKHSEASKEWKAMNRLLGEFSDECLPPEYRAGAPFGTQTARPA